MVFLPKLRQQIMVSAAHAFHMRRFIGVQPAWAVAVTRPVTTRDILSEHQTFRRLKVRHLRLLFGLACLLLLLAILLTQPAATSSAPYLTYDKVLSVQAEPTPAGQPYSARSFGAASSCSMLTVALHLCTP